MEQLLNFTKKLFVHFVVCSTILTLFFGLTFHPTVAQTTSNPPANSNPVQPPATNEQLYPISIGPGSGNPNTPTPPATGGSQQTTIPAGGSSNPSAGADTDFVDLGSTQGGVGVGTAPQSGYGYSGGNTVTNPNNPGQAGAVSAGNSVTGSSQTSGLTDTAAGLAGCLVGGLVSGIISGALQSVMGAIDWILTVPTTSGASMKNTGGIFGWPPSLDSIAYCIINAMIDYIANATIEWINSGFDGNPAFVQDPERFFKDIATIEAGSFLNEVVYNTTGLNICEPFRLEIVAGVGAQYGTMQNRFQCSLEQIGMNAQDFDIYTSGQGVQSGDLGTWLGVTQNPQNNRYGVQFMAMEEAQRRVGMKQNTARVDLTQGNGFLSFKRCNPDSTTTNERGETVQVKGACAITTPGHVIEDQLNSKLKMGDQRLVLADKFDQVVSSLVNALIKTALNQVLNNTGIQ